PNVPVQSATNAPHQATPGLFSSPILPSKRKGMKTVFPAGRVGPGTQATNLDSPMRDLVEAFIGGVTPAEQAMYSNRRLAIRLVITEYENMIRAGSPGADDAIQSFVQQAKDRAFEEISRHSPNGIPTPRAEFYQDMFDELSTRSRLSIGKVKD